MSSAANLLPLRSLIRLRNASTSPNILELLLNLRRRLPLQAPRIIPRVPRKDRQARKQSDSQRPRTRRRESLLLRHQHIRLPLALLFSIQRLLRRLRGPNRARAHEHLHLRRPPIGLCRPLQDQHNPAPHAQPEQGPGRRERLRSIRTHPCRPNRKEAGV